MAFTLVLLLQLLLVSLVSASHHFGGTVTFTYKGRNPDGTHRVSIRNRATYDGCLSHYWQCYSGNCGYNTKTERGILDRSTNAPQYNSQWCETETVITTILNSDKPFQNRAYSCCWIPTRNWVNDWNLLTYVDLGTRSDTRQPNRSPDIAILPFLRVPQNCPRTYKLMAFDPDGDQVRCRYGNIIGTECSSCSQPSGFHLDEGSCTLHYHQTYADPRVFGFELVVEDFPQRYINLGYTDGSSSSRAPLTIRRRKRQIATTSYQTPTPPSQTTSAYSWWPWWLGYTSAPPTTSPQPWWWVYTAGPTTTPPPITTAAPWNWWWLPATSPPTTAPPATTAAPWNWGWWQGTSPPTTTPPATTTAPWNWWWWQGTSPPTTTPPATTTAPWNWWWWQGTSPPTTAPPATTTRPATTTQPSTTTPTTPWQWWWWQGTTTPTPTTQWPWWWWQGTTTTTRPSTTTPTPTTQWPWWWWQGTTTTTRPSTTTPTPTTQWPWWWWQGTTTTTRPSTTTPTPTTQWPWWWWQGTTTTTPTPTTPWQWWWWQGTTTATRQSTTTSRTPTTTTPTATTRQLYATTAPLSKLPLQFSLLVDPPAPSCQEGLYLPKFLPPTPVNGARVQAEVDKEVEIRVKAQASYAAIFDIIISGPTNITKHRNTHDEFVIRWTPTSDDLGDYYPICFAVESVTGSAATFAQPTQHYHGTPSSQSGIYQSEMRCVLVDVRKNQVKSHVSCTESSMIVEVEKSSLSGFHEDNLRLSDATDTVCSLQRRSNSTHIIAVVPLNSCGTQIEEDDDNLIFKNEITTIDNNQDLITRKHLLEVQFYCQYPKRGNVTLGFTAHRKNVTVWERGFGTFTYQFEFYPDTQFRTMIDPNSYPLEYEIGSRVYMEIEATSSVNNTELFVESCRAAPYDNPNYHTTYSIIENGCKVDPTVEIYSPSHEKQFKFSLEAFKFIGLHDQVYISCSVLMCEAGNPNTRCSQGCINSTSSHHHHHRKRDAVIQSANHFVSQGPLRLRRSAESAGVTVTNLNLNLVFIAGCLLVAIGMVCGVAMYKAKMSKVKYQPLPTFEN